MNMKEWLAQATAKIAFAPDREAVRQELADHLQDRQDRYAAQGLSSEEAEQAALADMGSAADIAEELGKLHRPWWGYIWVFSKCVLGLAVFVFILVFLYEWDLFGPKEPTTHLWESYPYSDMTLLSSQKLPERAKVGNYTVSASTILLEGTDPLEGTDGARFLFVTLRFHPHIPWEPIQLSLLYSHRLDNICIIDDSGELYTLMNGKLRDTGILQDTLNVCLPLGDGSRPQWVDIPLGSSHYTIRLDLEEGVSVR